MAGHGLGNWLIILLLGGCASAPQLATPGASYQDLVEESKDPAKVAEAQKRRDEFDAYYKEHPFPGARVVKTSPDSKILNVTGSKELAVACQLADGATTFYALTHGAAEVNPFIAWLGPWGIVALKITLASLLWVYHEEIGTSATTFVNAVTCGAAVHNLSVIKGLK
mgnify:CR=1 FL=1